MIRGRARQANQGAKRAAASPFYQYAARAGYVARGVLFIALGLHSVVLARYMRLPGDSA